MDDDELDRLEAIADEIAEDDALELARGLRHVD